MSTQTRQWNTETLGKTVEIIDGDRGVNYPKQNEFSDSGYCLFLNTKNVPARTFVFEEKMFVTKEKDEKLRKGKLTRRDFVLTTRGTVGNFAYYSDNIPFENMRINSGMVILRLKTGGKLLSDFFRFYLDSPQFKGQIRSHTTGSAQPQLPIRDLSVFEILFPDTLTQQQIADVLSAYDNLIENNAHRIKILEQMAQAIYTDWFVNFCFPDHSKTKLFDSDTDFGKIPQGWKVATLSDLVENVRNATPSGEILKERNYVPIDAIDSQSLTLQKYNSWTEAKSSLILFEKGDILFGAMRPYFHKVAIAPFSGVTRGTCLVLRPKYDLAFCAVTLFQKETIDFATVNSQGATIPYINWNVLAKKKCLIPSNEVISAYSKYVQPLFELNQKLAQEIEKLIQSRDLLLPKLVTGEIKV